jgi:cytochrome P450
MAAAVQQRGPKRHFLAGNLPEFRRDRLGFLMDCARRHGDFVPLRFGASRAVFINNPDAIEQVLGSSGSFVKSFAYRMIRPVVANGLLLSEGDLWKRQRRLAQPAFQRARMAEAYTPVIIDCSERMLDRWTAGEVRDVHAEMMRLTSEVAGQAFFGADVSERAADVSHAMLVMTEVLTARMDSLLAILPDRLPSPANRKVREAVRHLDAIIYPIIERRRRSREGRDDLLSRFLAAQDEDGNQMSDTQLRDEVMTFFLAGHETTSLLLSWTLYLLSQHLGVQDRLRYELRDALNGRSPTLAQLGGLPYLDAVLCETLRLYPPVWGMGREPVSDCEVGGYPVAKGTSILFSQWVMHRDARFFERPDRFFPDRWTDGLQKRLPRYAYFPFGGGQRICIGANFAMMEAGIILSMLLARFRFEPAPDHEVVVWPGFTLRPRSGVHLAISKPPP